MPQHVVTIHQPEAFPWLGLIDKVSSADTFVVLDHVQFEKNYFQNRNRILTANGPTYLTIPVSRSSSTPLNAVEISYGTDWRRKHLCTWKDSYRRAPRFHDHIAFLERLYAERFTRLIDFNMTVIRYLLDTFEIGSKILFSSTLDVSGSKSDLILDICRNQNASVYIAGPSGRDYLDEPSFADAGIEIQYHAYRHPRYPQAQPKQEFTPYMSTFDLLFNQPAEQAWRTLKSGSTQ